MKIAIITRPDQKSPRILAEALKLQLEESGVSAFIFFEAAVVSRLVTKRRSGLNFHFWLRRKILNYPHDRKLLRTLRQFDALIISECIPNAFSEQLYNIAALKQATKKPVFLYEVYHIENAPTKLNAFTDKASLLKTYDGYLYVSSVTETKVHNPFIGFKTGLQSEKWNLKPTAKAGLLALVDFAQPGFEHFREQQIRMLEKAGIAFHCLEGSYTVNKIRQIYKRSSLFFVQFPEAFGLPILECLNCGVQIFTPNSGWPMSWRLNDTPAVHGPGLLPNCFTVYEDDEDLYQKLISFKKNYHFAETPKKIFDEFKSCYPDFYYGNRQGVKSFIDGVIEKSDRDLAEKKRRKTFTLFRRKV